MSTWADWTSCSVTSGQCQKTRSRTCNQGDCDDVPNEDLEQTQNCNDVDCPSPWIRISANDPQLGYQNGIAYPNYEVSLDLKLDAAISDHSIILGCSTPDVTPAANGGYPHGKRIPAVFVKAGENKLHIGSSVGGDDGNTWWDSEEYIVDEEFNLKIKECFQICSRVCHSGTYGSFGSRVFVGPLN